LTAPAIDVWRVSLAGLDGDPHGLRRLLCNDERRRAERFAFDRDRDRFVVAHAALRGILSLYAGVPASALEFRCDPGGKPRLARQPGPQFNLSHSADRALLAVAWHRELGVDVEAMRPLDDLDGLAATCFSPLERRTLAAVPEGRRLDAFFDGWTRKEAVLKLLGDGLSRELDSFDVTLAPGEPPALLRLDGGDPHQLALHAIDVGPGFRAALASEGPALSVRLRDWHGEGVTTNGNAGTGSRRRGGRAAQPAAGDR
jgi:4'-phosphopantetheinyl transferase